MQDPRGKQSRISNKRRRRSQRRRCVLLLVTDLIRSLAELPGVRVSSPTAEDRRSGIVNFAHRTLPVDHLHRELTRAGVSMVVRDNSIRLSPHFYQGEEQLEGFIKS